MIPAIVALVSNAAANRLIGSSKRLVRMRREAILQLHRRQQMMMQHMKMKARAASKAMGRITCILYHVLPSSSDDTEQ